MERVYKALDTEIIEKVYFRNYFLILWNLFQIPGLKNLAYLLLRNYKA